jgi:hypothetical protein
LLLGVHAHSSCTPQALPALQKWGLVAEGGDGRLAAVPLLEALKKLDEVWDSLYEFKVLLPGYCWDIAATMIALPSLPCGRTVMLAGRTSSAWACILWVLVCPSAHLDNPARALRIPPSPQNSNSLEAMLARSGRRAAVGEPSPAPSAYSAASAAAAGTGAATSAPAVAELAPAPPQRLPRVTVEGAALGRALSGPRRAKGVRGMFQRVMKVAH